MYFLVYHIRAWAVALLVLRLRESLTSGKDLQFPRFLIFKYPNFGNGEEQCIHMKKLLLTTLVLFVVSIYSHGQTKIIMEKEGGIYLVPCKVNGLPLKFIFDTGASDVSISLTEAVFMLKNSYLHKEDIGEDVWYGIANGDVAKGTIINIKEIEFAGLKLYNVKASVVHEMSAPLLLGQSAIEKLGKIQINGSELTILNKNENSYNYSGTDNDYVDSFSEGLAYIRKNGQYGYVNADGELVIPIKYTQALMFLNGVALVYENINGKNHSYFIDKKGNKADKDYAGRTY
jgi:clan AA aspartic protease (TIGR02281 family)